MVCLELVVVFDGYFVPQVLENDALLRNHHWLVQDFQRLLKIHAQFLKRSPLEGLVYADRQLPVVGLTSQVDLLGLNLVRDVDEQHIEVLVINVVGLEKNLDFVGGLGGDGCSGRDQHERHCLFLVGAAMHLGQQVEFDGE